MLHIILIILKIIGWIILAILGLLVLLICVVFFVPLCYKAEGKGEGSLDSLWGRFKFSWLFHLVSGQAEYENGKLSWKIRIACKKINSSEEPVQIEETYPEQETFQEEAAPPEEKLFQEKIKFSEEKPFQEKIELSEEKPFQEKIELSEEKRSRGEIPSPKEDPKTSETRFERICKKLKQIFQKIKYTFRKICGTIKSLVQKKERLTEFIENEIHRTAFSAVIKEVKRLLKFLAPRKWKVNAHFGFADPSYTGYLLAVISMIHPFIGEHTDIRPDFEQHIFEGDLMISGKIRMFYLAIIAWNLIWNKNVRTTYKHICNFKL